MLTYSKSTKRVRRMPMHLSSGHVTLMPGKFSPSSPPNFSQSDLGRRPDSRWALPQISSFVIPQRKNNLHTIAPNRVTWRWQIRNIHQLLNQPVKNHFNIALEAILKRFLTGHALLIFKTSMTTTTTDRRLAGGIMAKLYVVVSCVHTLWLNRTSYVISRRTLFVYFIWRDRKIQKFCVEVQKTNNNWRHRQVLKIFSPQFVKYCPRSKTDGNIIRSWKKFQ